MRYQITRDRTKIISSNGQENLDILRTVDKSDKEYFICESKDKKKHFFIKLKSIRSVYRTETLPTELRRELKRMDEGW